MITKNLPTLKINKLSKDQYDRALASDRIEDDEIYLIPEDEVPPEHIHDIKDIRSLQATLDSIPTIHSGTTEPARTLGKDGDIYIMYSE